MEQNAEIYPVGDVNQDRKVSYDRHERFDKISEGWAYPYEKAADMNAVKDKVWLIKVMK